MSNIELQAKIDKLENRKFLINMSDRLTRSDKEVLVQINEEIKALKAQMEANNV